MLRLTTIPGISPESLCEFGAMFGIAVIITDSAGSGVYVNSQWQALTRSHVPQPRDGWIAAFDAADHVHVGAAFERARLTGSSHLVCRLSTPVGPVRVELRICRMSTASGDVHGFAVGVQRRLS